MIFCFVRCSIVYIPSGDAAVHRQTMLMAKEADNNATVIVKSSTVSTR